MIATIRKALLAGVLAALTTLGAAMQAGQDLNWQLVLSALGVGVAAGAATWAVPNATVVKEPTL